MKMKEKSALISSLQGKIAPLYLLLSKEQHDTESSLESILAKLPADVTIARFDGEKGKVGGALDELNTLSLLGGMRVVVVRRVEKLRKDGLDRLADYSRGPNPQALLIMIGSGLRSNTVLYRACDTSGVVLDIPEQRPWEKERSYPQWVTEQFSQSGRRIDSAACRELLTRVGYDKTLLASEIEKLICYAGNKPQVTIGDLNAISDRSPHQTGWELGAAIFRGDATTAVRIGRELLGQGQALQSIVAQIRRQLQTDVQVLSIISSGGAPEEVTHEFGYMKGKVLEQHVQTARRYGMRRFRRGLLLVDKVDLLSRSSGSGPELLLDRLLVGLTSA